MVSSKQAYTKRENSRAILRTIIDMKLQLNFKNQVIIAIIVKTEQK